MSVRMRQTRGHTANRRSHHALENFNIIKDKETGSLRLPHRLDEITGMYRGKQIASPKVAKVTEHKHRDGTKHDHAKHEAKAVEAKTVERSTDKKEPTRHRTRSGTGA